MAIKPTAVNKAKQAMKEALLKRMKQGQSVSSGSRSYFKEGLEGVSFWSPKEGDHVLDIIPYLAGPNDPQVAEGDPTYVLEIFVHRDVGGIENQSFICMEKTFKKPCPICEHRKVLQKEGADEDLIKSLQPSRYPRSIYNVVVYDSEKDESKGVQIFETSHYLFEMYLLKLATSSGRGGARPQGFIPFADVDEGKSICFTRQGTSTNTRFIAHRFEDRSYTISKEIQDQAHQLDQLLHIPTYDEVYAAYWGETPEEEALPKTSGGESRRSVRAPAKQPTEPEAEAETEEPEAEAETEEAEAEEPDAEAQAMADALESMDRAELRKFIADNNLGIITYKSWDEARIRTEILAALEQPEAEAETEEPEESPATTKPKPATKPTAGDTKCPGGGEFGKDLNELPHCEVCKVWDACLEANEKLTAQKQAATEKKKAVAAPKRTIGARK